MRAVAVAVAVVGLGCADEPSVTSVDEPTRVIEAPVMWPLAPAVADATLRRTPPDPLLTGWLDGCAVDDESFARLKLYTWTTAERIDELRSDRLLLAHGRMPGEMSRFDAEITGDPYPLAARLRTTRRGRRYAWVSPWPTRMGWEGHDYGEHLVEITLREDAWFARFAPGTPERWRVLDENGRVVPEAEVRQNIGRIAAVYHVASGDNAYREIIVVDERHVDRWAFATPALRDRLRQDAAQLRALAARFERARPTIPEDQAAWLRAGWSRRPADDADLVERYRSCLALGSPLYRPTPERLRGMAAAMEATPSVAPLEHTVRRDRTWGVVMSTRTMCDETTACWETWQRAGTLSIRTR